MPDHGQAAVLVVIIGATLFVLMMTALSSLGSRVLDRVQAQTAADAAALASLDGGRQIADQIAHRHGAIVISWWRGACTPCVKSRGYEQDDLLEGVVISGASPMHKLIAEGAATLSF